MIASSLLFFQFNLSENNRNYFADSERHTTKMMCYMKPLHVVLDIISSGREPAWPDKDSVLLCLHPHSSLFLPSTFMHIRLLEIKNPV